jgi:hypothetical protein
MSDRLLSPRCRNERVGPSGGFTAAVAYLPSSRGSSSDGRLSTQRRLAITGRRRAKAAQRALKTMRSLARVTLYEVLPLIPAVQSRRSESFSISWLTKSFESRKRTGLER